ncbi:hypothetical protein DFH09DRAFT_144832 [Mycena vulgaris]|nr:hypothetical protein DFH09DRAFT_144832 [Mycena vulgaris]
MSSRSQSTGSTLLGRIVIWEYKVLFLFNLVLVPRLARPARLPPRVYPTLVGLAPHLPPLNQVQPLLRMPGPCHRAAFTRALFVQQYSPEPERFWKRRLSFPGNERDGHNYYRYIYYWRYSRCDGYHRRGIQSSSNGNDEGSQCNYRRVRGSIHTYYYTTRATDRKKGYNFELIKPRVTTSSETLSRTSENTTVFYLL